jgi:two-component system, NarL family, sensor kinase
MDTTLIIIGITAMLLLASGVVMFVILYQRRVINHHLELKKINEEKDQELREASISAGEDERTRIASELHDDIGATLASIRLFLHGAGNGGDGNMVFAQSKELLDETISKVRGISHSLHPATLQHLGLRGALQSFFDMIGKTGAITVLCRIQDGLPRIADKTELSLYRMVQELTNNILKHAHATILQFDASAANGQMNLLITHNGAGITDEDFNDLIYKKDAIGLKNIVNRTRSVNGDIRFEKGEKEYYIVITVPR